jgi:predicted TIM-barrel fold metal-dependent hydrolase
MLRTAQTAMTIIDAHAHAGPFSLFFIPDCEPASMVRVMDRCGVTRAVLSAHQALQLDASTGNELTARAVSAFPDRLSGYFTVNPWQDPVAEVERWADDPRFVGIKVHPDLHTYPILGSRYATVWEYAEKTGAPVLTHTGPDSLYNDITMVDVLAEAHPEVAILAGHAGGARRTFDDSIAVALRHPNIVLELCGSTNHGTAITRMVDEVGSAQVVFGSDFPFIDLRSSLARVVFARLSETDRAAVLGLTMQALLARRTPGSAGDS